MPCAKTTSASRYVTPDPIWTGWPTFPMVFVKAILVGGASDLARLIAKGELARMLGGKRTVKRTAKRTAKQTTRRTTKRTAKRTSRA